MGLGLQIAGNWLPTRVICYKTNEKPKIEFSFNGCECSQNDSHAALDGRHEYSARLQRSGCFDLPLTWDPACDSPIRSTAIHRVLNLGSRPWGVPRLPHFPLAMKPGIEYPPPGLEMTGCILAFVPRLDKNDSILGHFRC